MTRSAPELASRLRVAVARLSRRLRQEGMEEGASPSQVIALSTIYRDGPLTLGSLAAAERVKPPTMTRIVAALEERGLVQRETSSEDGRVVRVTATPAGRRTHEESRKRRDEWLCRRLKGLGAEDRELLVRAADVLDRLGDG